MLVTRAALLLALLVVACSRTSQVGDDPPELSHAHLEVEDVVGRVLFTDSLLGLPTAIALVGKFLVVADLAADSTFHVLDTTSGALRMRFGRRGAGPREFRSTWSMDPIPGTPSDFWAYDLGLRRLTRLRLEPDDTANGPSVVSMINLEADGTPTGPIWIDDSTLVSLGFFPSGRVAFFTESGKQHATVGALPLEASNVPATVRQHVFQATLVVHPDRHLLAAATRHTAQLEIYWSDGKPKRVVQGPLPVEPRYGVRNTAAGPVMETGRDLRFGYIHAAASSEYVFALFSGRTRRGFPGQANFGRFVHVFDWNGDLVSVLRLDQVVLTIAVDPSATTLYAVRHHPHPAIIQYRLPIVPNN